MSHAQLPCRTVFDLAAVGYSGWSAVAIAAAITLGITILMLVLTKLTGKTPVPAGLWLGPIVAAVITVVIFATSWTEYRTALEVLQTGRYESVEGPVENFVPRPITGHSLERFSVAGRHFEFSDFNLTPGYRRSRARGGVFAPGVYVRLRVHSGTILHVEVCDDSSGDSLPKQDAVSR